jgi:hypothetical protein
VRRRRWPFAKCQREQPSPSASCLNETRARIIGNVITDDAHWWDHYQADGTIDSSDMGRRTRGRWQIKKGQLCIWRGSLDGECYDVWVAGDEVQLRSEGLEPFPAYIRRVDRR